MSVKASSNFFDPDTDSDSFLLNRIAKASGLQPEST
jgi:hypothetical protein